MVGLPPRAVDIDGARRYEGSELSSTTATVGISGSGTATVRVDSLEVDLAGSGSVTSHGDPAVTRQVSGSGQVVRA